MSTVKSLTQLNHELAAADDRLALLRSQGYLEEGTLIVTVRQTIGRLLAQGAQREPALLAA